MKKHFIRHYQHGGNRWSIDPTYRQQILSGHKTLKSPGRRTKLPAGTKSPRVARGRLSAMRPRYPMSMERERTTSTPRCVA